ncbi:biotin/lipoyl-containing protein [Amphibacillus cookii]|uniref:biotin/lipoyl-containing protein n=1 Tax=Amphibacillus cookii TaxID=767787 RepID=UPI00195B6304|nr:acetyl-CoA carboxylase biotin carboxyl carrier protein subunit [Amphibacillus cookii]MBM7540207.1 biotin carboxyl carrier protein [Amphibacillus cookii]
MKTYEITVNGQLYQVKVEERNEPSADDHKQCSEKTVSSTNNEETDGEKIHAPMPGVVFDLKVAKGDHVKKGEILCILEAMKMENEIVAQMDGIIQNVHVTKDQTVEAGDILFTL